MAGKVFLFLLCLNLVSFAVVKNPFFLFLLAVFLFDSVPSFVIMIQNNHLFPYSEL